MDEETPKNNSPFEALKGTVIESLMFKACIIVFVIIMLMIPRHMIEGLVEERKERNHEVVKEISGKWGDEQVLHGPVLTIPCKSKKGDETIYLNAYPDELSINGKLEPSVRKRSIFKAVLYNADMNISGDYKLDLSKVPEGFSADLNKATLSFGISDLSGITSRVLVNINDVEHKAKSGIAVTNGLKSGFHIPLDLQTTGNEFSFALNLSVNGSRSIYAVPSGQVTKVNMHSTWKHPSFTGEFLPKDYSIEAGKGFDAEWEVHDLQRNLKQYWYNADSDKTVLMGVNLFQVTNVYNQIGRIIKYAILFLCFTFAAIFISERLTGVNLHPLQYVLVGCASMIFYALLLSFSEHFSFNKSYIVTSVLVTGLITLYAKGAFGGWKGTSVLGSVTAGLYAFLYGTIQMEDYALLFGSCGLFVLLAVVMFITRKINVEEAYKPLKV